MKRFPKRLHLSKETISNLNGNEMERLNGGLAEAPVGDNNNLAGIAPAEAAVSAGCSDQVICSYFFICTAWNCTKANCSQPVDCQVRSYRCA